MKRYFVIITFFLLMTVQASSSRSEDYFPGELYVKFRPSGVSKKNNVSSADKMLADFGATEIRQAFIIPPNLGSKKISADARTHLESIASIKRVSLPKNLDMEYVAKKLSAHPDIEYAEPIYIFKFHDIPDDPDYNGAQQEYLDFISAPQAWEIAKGDTSVVVAIVDSGTDWNHPDLMDNLWTNSDEIPDNNIDDDANGYVDDVHGWDFHGSEFFGTINGDNDPTSTTEPHGTHVTGIAAAVTNNGIGIASLSYNVKYMPLKTGPDDGEGISFGYEGVMYAASNGADVINCSWGSPQYSSTGVEVIGFAVSMGVIIVASAGNDGSERVVYPAAYPDVIAVGSINLTGEKSIFSNYGPTVDVSAPGSLIYSTLLNDSYGLMSGTSMAAPVVSALAALIKSANKGWDSDQIMAQIVGTASQISSDDPNEYLCGCGYINAEKALGNPVLYINITDYAFTDKNGNNDGLFARGEQIEASFSIRNCGEKADNVTVYFTSLTGYVIPSMPGISIGTLEHKEEKSFNNISFAVIEDVPVDAKEYIRLDFETSDGSINFETIDVVVNPSYATFTANNIELSIDDKGHIGYTDYPDNTRGSAFIVHNDFYSDSDVFNIPLLFEGGLLIGNSENRISDSIRGEDQSIRENNFAVSESFIFENAPDDSFQRGTVVFTDAYAEQQGSNNISDSVANPPIKVTLTASAYSEPEHDQYIILEYIFENDGNKTLNDLRAGLFLDFDIPESEGDNDYAFYAKEDDILIITEDAEESTGKLMVGAAVSDSIYTPWLIDNASSDEFFFGIYDGFTDEEKWRSLSGGKPGGIEKGPGDVSMVLSPDSFTLQPGEGKKITFILAYGMGYEDLKSQIMNARMRDHQIVPDVNEEYAQNQAQFSIRSIYPNPFNPNTTIRISLPEPDIISLNIYDILGRHVDTVFSGFKSSGEHNLVFNGRRFASGIYFVGLETESGYIAFKKITILK